MSPDTLGPHTGGVGVSRGTSVIPLRGNNGICLGSCTTGFCRAEREREGEKQGEREREEERVTGREADLLSLHHFEGGMHHPRGVVVL